jgi:hypothetical protein
MTDGPRDALPVGDEAQLAALVRAHLPRGAGLTAPGGADIGKRRRWDLVAPLLEPGAVKRPARPYKSPIQNRFA